MNSESPTERTYTSFVLYDEDEYEQRFNNVGTTSEQDTNSVRTTSEQCTNNVGTESVQRQDKNQTSVARAAKRPQDTHYTVYKNNLDIIKILTTKKFIRVNTSGTYSDISQLPLSRAPIDLTTAVQRCGYPVSRDELAKIYTAANVCRRVPRFKVWAISIAVCIMSVYLTTVGVKIKDYGFSGKQQTNVLAANSGPGTPDFETTISDFERRNRFKFYPYRNGLILNELQKETNTDNYEFILQTNMAAQIRATAKGGKK